MLSRVFYRTCAENRVYPAAASPVGGEILWPHLAALWAPKAAEKRENYRQTNPERPPKITVTEKISNNPFCL